LVLLEDRAKIEQVHPATPHFTSIGHFMDIKYRSP
jgi:hypothetical protein